MNITQIFSVETRPTKNVIEINKKTTVFVFDDNSALYVRVNHKYIATTVYIPNVYDEQNVAHSLAKAQDATAYTTAKNILEGVKITHVD